MDVANIKAFLTGCVKIPKSSECRRDQIKVLWLYEWEYQSPLHLRDETFFIIIEIYSKCVSKNTACFMVEILFFYSLITGNLFTRFCKCIEVLEMYRFLVKLLNLHAGHQSDHTRLWCFLPPVVLAETVKLTCRNINQITIYFILFYFIKIYIYRITYSEYTVFQYGPVIQSKTLETSIIKYIRYHINMLKQNC